MSCTRPGVLEHLSFLLWGLSASSSLPTHFFGQARLSPSLFLFFGEQGGAQKTDPLRSLCDSLVDVALGTGVKHLTLVSAVRNERGRDFFHFWKEPRILNPTASSSKVFSSVLYSLCTCVGVASGLAGKLLELLPRTHYFHG